MSQAVKISDDEMEAVRQAANIHNRSIAGQAEHWMRLGRAVERDPRFGFLQIEQALRGLRPVSSLSDEQQEEFFDRFAEETLNPTERELHYWARMEAEDRRLGAVEVDSSAPAGSRSH